jgi:hypothetical protein
VPLLLAAPAAGAERARAAIECRVTPEKLVYACTIALRRARSGEPLTGAEVVVGADMPSMPLAHNVKPATGAPTDVPGSYAATLHLEMLGDWAVHVTVTGPLRDRLVEVLTFTAEGATPAKAAPRGSGSGSGSGSDKQ